MAVSKVTYGTTTLIDLTGDTVTADKLLAGYTAHRADGEAINGAIRGLSQGFLKRFDKVYEYDSSNVAVCGYPDAGTLYCITENSKLSAVAPFSEFGDATAADVAAGKTFTSAAGLLVTGTKEDSAGGGIQAQHITSASEAITISGSGTVKVWGYGYYASGSGWQATKNMYAFVGDGYYKGSLSYNATTPTKTSVSFSISNGTLSGLPSGLTALDVLVTIGA